MTDIFIPVHLSAVKEWIRWQPRLNQIPFDGLEWCVDDLCSANEDEIQNLLIKMKHDYPTKQIGVRTNYSQFKWRELVDFINISYDQHPSIDERTILRISIQNVAEMEHYAHFLTPQQPKAICFEVMTTSMTELLDYLAMCHSFAGRFTLEDKGGGQSLIQRLAPYFHLAYVDAVACHCSLAERNELTSSELEQLWKEGL